MFADFHCVDRWSGNTVHVMFQALIVAIATRHADAVDVKFLVDGHPVWIALPHPAWPEYQKSTGKIITDPLCVEIAGHFLRESIENGEYSGQEMLTMTVPETLRHADSVIEQIRQQVDRGEKEAATV